MKFLKRNSVFVIALFVACAHQIPPGGGPDDKTPPAVRSTAPSRGALNVSVNTAITITFSEWIQPLNVDRSVTMFPPPKGGIKVTVSGKKLVVKPKQALADSTTYHLALNTALSDLHGNSIGTPLDLFFSTGPTIDSSRIFGCVIMQDGKAQQPKVALFPAGAADSSDTVLFGMPSYLTQTDSAGFFSFDNIHRGSYVCVAFLDDNNNGRLDPGREQVFAPVKKRIALDKAAGPVPLYPVVCDTTAMRITTLKPLSPTCLYGEWTGAITMAAPVWDMHSWHIKGVNDNRNVPVKAYVPVQGSRRFFLKLADTLGLAPFRLFTVIISPLRRSVAKGDTVNAGDTIRFNGVTRSDTVPPAVRGVEPPPGTAAAVELKPLVKLVWSKPVTANFTRWNCLDSAGDSVAARVSPGYGDTTFFFLAKSLVPDTKYSMKFPDSAFSDICGNSPVDTAGIKIGFRTMLDRDLCFSMSGGIPCHGASPSADSLRKWIFMPLGGQKRYVVPDKGGQFRYDSIPSGRGLMGLFTDVNGDGMLTKGSLVPWSPPEPFRMFPDTVEARKNWDIEGVTFTGACEECVKKTAPKPSADSTKTK
jgi:uncharacterized protein (DUF2141 family)